MVDAARLAGCGFREATSSRRLKAPSRLQALFGSGDSWDSAIGARDNECLYLSMRKIVTALQKNCRKPKNFLKLVDAVLLQLTRSDIRERGCDFNKRSAAPGL